MENLQMLEDVGLDAVLRTALDAVVVMDMRGLVTGWNAVAERTFGWSAAEAVGRRMSDMVIPPRHRAAHERGLDHYRRTGEGPALDCRLEIDALHRDGHELPVELSITRTEQFGQPVFLGFLRDITERRESARRQERMIGELNHRAKNMLAVVGAIAHQTARSSADMAQFTAALDGRLSALARTHELLTEAGWERASLSRLIGVTFGSEAATGRIAISGPDVLLEPRQLLGLGMVLHELRSNARRYGALSQPDGRLALGWAQDIGGLVMRWTEAGMRGIAAPDRRGFGWRTIALGITHDLGGTIEQNWRDEGLACVIRIPAAGGGAS